MICKANWFIEKRYTRYYIKGILIKTYLHFNTGEEVLHIPKTKISRAYSKVCGFGIPL